MSDTIESLTKRVEVLEGCVVSQGRRQLELAKLLEEAVKRATQSLENSHLLLDKLGVPR